jgi:methylenetetrahydrofolate dehydrogenase (NADP+)/methenyltetrahydrofolate cyclohydrolase
MDYLEYNKVTLAGKVCTVIGRSEIVGKPLVNLLIDRGATVISCNSKTPNIKQFTKNSDIVISAIGKANYFTEDYFSGNQILIDVGINRDEKGKLCGDIAKEAKEDAWLATPVPNGVGLLTRLALVDNVIQACFL